MWSPPFGHSEKEWRNLNDKADKAASRVQTDLIKKTRNLLERPTRNPQTDTGGFKPIMEGGGSLQKAKPAALHGRQHMGRI